MTENIITLAALITLTVYVPPLSAAGRQITLIQRPPDPHGTPRPALKACDVPLETSIYLELGLSADLKDDQILPESVAVRMLPQRGEPLEILQPGRHFAAGCSGWLPAEAKRTASRAGRLPRAGQVPEARDCLHGRRPCSLAARRGAGRNRGDLDLHHRDGPPRPHVEVPARLRCRAGPLARGILLGHLQRALLHPGRNLRAHVRPDGRGPQETPQGVELPARLLDDGHGGPETCVLRIEPAQHRPPARDAPDRRAMEKRPEGVLLHVEDFFGRRQYGIPAGRSVAEDYHAGDEVLIADGLHDARAKVLAADDAAGTVLVGPVAAPPGGWKVAYEGPLPEREDPDAPGLFPPGGCYLRKVRPHGTPCYYWGRLDKEWDLVHRRYGRRLLVNFADAPGDLSRDGRSWTTVKDYAEWHEVAGRIAGHLIDRYGAAALDLLLEHLQRARSGTPVLADRLGRTATLLRLHDRRHSAGLRGPRL